MFRRLLTVCFLLFALLPTLQAQFNVELQMTRTLYMVHEPILAKISITNLSGKDQNFTSRPGRPWFGFEIFAGVNKLIPPNNPDYQLGDLYVPAGKTVSRNMNLTPLYSLQEYGPHSVKAVLYNQEQDQYYTSTRRAFEITEGLLLWKQSVGVPATNSTHTYSLLSHRLPRENRLYVRIIDETGGRVVSCFSVGRIVTFAPPTYILDGQNNLHILQMIGPKAYLYTEVSPTGEILSRVSYVDGKSNPRLQKKESGLVSVRGGKVDAPIPPGQRPKVPRLSDRPAGI